MGACRLHADIGIYESKAVTSSLVWQTQRGSTRATTVKLFSSWDISPKSSPSLEAPASSKPCRSGGLRREGGDDGGFFAAKVAAVIPLAQAREARVPRRARQSPGRVGRGGDATQLRLTRGPGAQSAKWGSWRCPSAKRKGGGRKEFEEVEATSMMAGCEMSNRPGYVIVAATALAWLVWRGVARCGAELPGLKA